MDQRWDKSKPPQGPFVLNQDCPQAQGLVAWYPMGGASAPLLISDMAGSSHLNVGTGGKLTLGANGQPMLDLSAASSQYAARANALVTGYPFSASTWVRQNTLGTYWVFGGGNSSDDNQYWGLVTINTGEVRSTVSCDANLDLSSTTTATVAAGTTNNIIGVFSASNSGAVYLNGGNSTTSNANQPAFPTLTNISVGTLNRTSRALFVDGQIGESCVWNRAISSDVIQRSNDPATRFELWYPLRSRKWFTQAAGAVPSITAVTASAITSTSVTPVITLNFP